MPMLRRPHDPRRALRSGHSAAHHLRRQDRHIMTMAPMATTRGSTADLGQRAGDPVRPDGGNRETLRSRIRPMRSTPRLPGHLGRSIAPPSPPRTIPQTRPRGEIPIAHGPGPRLPPLEAFDAGPQPRRTRPHGPASESLHTTSPHSHDLYRISLPASLASAPAFFA
jgi:hypothetical protein